LDKIEIANLL